MDHSQEFSPYGRYDACNLDIFYICYKGYDSTYPVLEHLIVD